jgi:hypothetical protein
VRRLSTATASHTPLDAVSSASTQRPPPSIPVYARVCVHVVCRVWHVDGMSCVEAMARGREESRRLSLLHLPCVFKCVYLVCLFECAGAAGRANRRPPPCDTGAPRHLRASRDTPTRPHALIKCNLYCATTTFALCPAVPRPQGI